MSKMLKPQKTLLSRLWIRGTFRICHFHQDLCYWCCLGRARAESRQMRAQPNGNQVRGVLFGRHGTMRLGCGDLDCCGVHGYFFRTISDLHKELLLNWGLGTLNSRVVLWPSEDGDWWKSRQAYFDRCFLRRGECGIEEMLQSAEFHRDLGLAIS